MKLFLYAIMTLFVYDTTQAQISSNRIETNPYAELDLVANNNGVLIPRVELLSFDNSLPITGDAETVPPGLLVFHKSEDLSNTLTPGYYYWYNSRWNKMATPDNVDHELPRPWNEAEKDNLATNHTQNIYQMGHIGIKTSDITSGLTLVNDGSNDTNDDITITSYKNSSNHRPEFFIEVANGTEAAPQNLTINQASGTFHFRAYTNYAFTNLSGIEHEYKGTGNDLLSKIKFSTTTKDQMVLTEKGTVGIGTTTPNPGAALDLTATNKGVLLPRIALKGRTDASTIPNPANGLLIQNTVESPESTPQDDFMHADKFYFWADDHWDLLLNQSKTSMFINRSLATLGVPQSAIFSSTNDQSNFLDGISAGGLQSIPMSQIINNIPDYISYNPSTSLISFRPGVYTITMVFDASHNNAGCTLSSYFIDFPTDTGVARRIHNTSAHLEGVNSNHMDTITFTSRLNRNLTWTIRLGRGQSGNCTGTGMTLYAKSTQVTVLRISD